MKAVWKAYSHHPILSDAAFEDGAAGIGAVLVDTLGGRPEVYDGQIPEDLIRHWQSTGQQQVISQAELAVVVAMRHMLKERLLGRRVMAPDVLPFGSNRITAIKVARSSRAEMDL